MCPYRAPLLKDSNEAGLQGRLLVFALICRGLFPEQIKLICVCSQSNDSRSSPPFKAPIIQTGVCLQECVCNNVQRESVSIDLLCAGDFPLCQATVELTALSGRLQH